MAQTYTVPRGASRVIDEFSVEVNGTAQDLSGWMITVVVDDDRDSGTSPRFSATCPLKEGDTRKALVRVEGAATENATTRDLLRYGCVHTVSPDGAADSVEFVLRVTPHA